MPHFAERDEKTNAFRQQVCHTCVSLLPQLFAIVIVTLYVPVCLS